MLRGRIVADLDPANVSQGDLGGYMTGALTQNGNQRTGSPDDGIAPA
jgi:hypothetical protein